MYWMYAGYLLPFYLVFAFFFFRDLPQHPRWALQAIAGFGSVSLVLLIATGEPVLLASGRNRNMIRNRFETGSMTRMGALCGGFLLGTSAFAIAMAIWFGL